ncbi:hypothetical protein DUNSADRAFT_17693 [Dunaliella salina]|uniref:Uncharacterized protein n=1 Tax=Dunaliella salina TaxID=3046 RepID=A0ABQ7G1A1_DUNSA|nr:hypothetical protein DUNSADRAFT_17693 [Dunaliella salina]|eukprot:KAF5828378.1 hypothetical protein DUNSADRAFT_17693 [Dunaliella salina]
MPLRRGYPWAWIMVAVGCVLLISTLRSTSWEELAESGDPKIGMGFSLGSLGLLGLSRSLDNTTQLTFTTLILAAFVGLETSPATSTQRHLPLLLPILLILFGAGAAYLIGPGACGRDAPTPVDGAGVVHGAQGLTDRRRVSSAEVRGMCSGPTGVRNEEHARHVSYAAAVREGNSRAAPALQPQLFGVQDKIGMYRSPAGVAHPRAPLLPPGGQLGVPGTTPASAAPVPSEASMMLMAGAGSAGTAAGVFPGTSRAVRGVAEAPSRAAPSVFPEGSRAVRGAAETSRAAPGVFSETLRAVHADDSLSGAALSMSFQRHQISGASRAGRADDPLNRAGPSTSVFGGRAYPATPANPAGAAPALSGIPRAVRAEDPLNGAGPSSSYFGGRAYPVLAAGAAGAAPALPEASRIVRADDPLNGAGPSMSFGGRTYQAMARRHTHAPSPQADAAALHALLSAIERESNARVGED